MQNAIPYNDIDFEENIYNFFTFMKYKGELFTGTLIDNNLTIEYKNGNAHGRSVEYYDNGQIASDRFYENGEYKDGKEWYPNGQIKYDSIGKEWYLNGQLKRDSTGQDSYWWDIDGMLAKTNDSWLYKNGQKVNDRNMAGYTCIYSSIGDLAIKTIGNNNGTHKAIYFDPVLSYCYEELLFNLYPDLNPNFPILYTIFGWVGQTYSQNKIKGKMLIHKLMEHNYSHTKDFANNLNNLATQKESGSTYKTYWLENNPNHTIVY